MTTTNIKQLVLAAALGLGAAEVANAQTSNSIVKFSVDMNIAGAPSSTLDVRGNFNGWSGGSNLVQNGTSGIWTNTFTITTLSNGAPLQFKFVKDDSYEGTASFNNRAAMLPGTSGGSLVLPTPYYNDGGTPVSADVTFKVDMAQQINTGAYDTGTNLYVRGNFNGWSSTMQLTNDTTIRITNQFGLVTSNVYVGTFSVSGSTNASMDFKYYYYNGVDQYESVSFINQDGGQNRWFVFGVNGVTNPIVYFNDAPYAPVATNTVTFQVDMAAQLLAGRFDPSQDQLYVKGSFISWNGGAANLMTNDPVQTNIYRWVYKVVDGVGATEQYKFSFEGANVPGGTDWENPQPPTVGGNRFFIQPSATATTLPLTYYSDSPLSDYLATDTLVTFNVNMTNAHPYTNNVIFNSSADHVYLNGDWLGWLGWNPVTLAAYELTNNPVGSTNYSLVLNLPKGSPVRLTYKYGINGIDNEAASEQNHVRVVRQTAVPNYSFTRDTFGNQYQEPNFGQLAVGNASGGTAPVSWLGRPAVRLQTKTSLSGGVWTELLATDGTNWISGHASTNGFVSVTNYPTGGGQTFFRLVKVPK